MPQVPRVRIIKNNWWGNPNTSFLIRREMYISGASRKCLELSEKMDGADLFQVQRQLSHPNSIKAVCLLVKSLIFSNVLGLGIKDT